MPSLRLGRARAASILALTGLAFTGSLALSGHALANQPGLPGAPTGGPGGPTQAGKDKKEGPAEEAPKDKEALRPIEEVPAQPAKRRRVQFFEAHGYMRMRADFFHRMNMGQEAQVQSEGLDVGVGKFLPPPAQLGNVNEDGEITANNGGCVSVLSERGSSAAQISRRCSRRNGITSANLRLRITPTFHISDSVEVVTTIDALDNLVLGSTPDSYSREVPWAPIDIYTRSQQPPQAGVNSLTDSVSVKQAYGHIHFGWGLDVKFGRMFNQWGMGMVYNSGDGYDRGQKDDLIRHLDQDWGDTVDSVALAFDLGKDPRNTHRLSVSYDWAATGPTAAQLLGTEYASGNTLGQDFSAERTDNVVQFSAAIERRDEPSLLKRKLSLGEPVVNYGLKTWLRLQTVDAALAAPTVGDGNGLEGDDNSAGYRDGYQPYANALVARRAVIATPDLWFRVNWRTLRVELEAAANVGRYYTQALEDSLNADYDFTAPQATERNVVINGGYALEFKYGLFDDRFHIGLDQGYASGDNSATQTRDFTGALNTEQFTDGRDARLRNFRFNPAYTQDLLLFRETLGTVSNAVYFRPWAAFYFFQDYFSARADFQYAFAQAPTATPGNKYNYGLELNGAIRYHGKREPIFVQVQYGVLFPFGAFDVDNARPNTQDNGRGLPEGGLFDVSGDARAQQTVQAQIGIRF